MTDTLEAMVGRYMQGKPSCIVTLTNSTESATFEITDPETFDKILRPVLEENISYELLFDPKFRPTDQALVDSLKRKISDLSDGEIYPIDFHFLDPQNLMNARDHGEIYCLTKLSEVRNGGQNFERETVEGKWVKSLKDIPVHDEGNNKGKKVQLGIKSPWFYQCNDKELSDRWLMKQITLHESQWLPGKEKECEKFALCHIYRKHSNKNQSVHNGSSS